MTATLPQSDDALSTPGPSSEPDHKPTRRGSPSWQRGVAVVLLITVVFGAAGALFVFLRTPSYTASVLVQISATEVTPTSNGDVLDDADLATQRLVMNSDIISQRVVSTLQLSNTPTSLQRDVTVQQVNDSQVLRLTVTWVSPDGAAAIANAFAAQYLTYRNEQRDARLAQIGDTGDKGLRPADGGQVITPATEAKHPAGITPTVVIILSAFLGLIVGLLLTYAGAVRRSSVYSAGSDV